MHNPQIKSPLQRVIETLPQVGRVESIAIRTEKRLPLTAVTTITLDAKSGLEGDHYSGKSGKRQVTLIQKEHLDAVAKMLHKEEADPLLSRRNIVVSGINLLAFKNRQFHIGDTLLEMTGPCEPCTRMEENFGPGGYNAMRGHGGICARILEGGQIKIGDSVQISLV